MNSNLQLNRIYTKDKITPDSYILPIDRETYTSNWFFLILKNS